MKRLPFLLAIATIVGCGYDYDTFGDDMLQTSCDKMEECEFFTDYFTYEDCLALGDVEDTGGEEWVCEDYDSGAAKECVDAWAAVSCDDFLTGTGLEICDDVCSND
jgi:hypothetical protein